MDSFCLSKEEALALYEQFKSGDYICWIGHATFLIKVDGLTILTDPFFSDISGAYGFGPRRFFSPQLEIEEIPQLDAILCTHNHFDHLDLPSLKRIQSHFGDEVKVFCPKGLRKYFIKAGLYDVVEMEWGDLTRFKTLKVFCFPAVHNSGRGIFDQNRTLWCSFGIQVEGKKVFFSGDTSYHPEIFRDAKMAMGGCDLAILGIGGYAPEGILNCSHVNPEQAVQIAKDLEAKKMIGMHWGTLNLSDEPVIEPIQRFQKAAVQEGMEEVFCLIKLGETRNLSNSDEQIPSL